MVNNPTGSESVGCGGKSPDRPGFQQMLKDAEAGRFQNIVVYKFDRFTRDAGEKLKAIERLERCGVPVVSILDE